MSYPTHERDLERASRLEDILSRPMHTKSVVANPAPLGLMGFALTTFVLSCHNAGVIIPQSAPHTVVTGLAAGYGGLAQLLAGMWEFSAGNTFGATAFSSYGAFWLSFAVIQIPAFGVRAAFLASESLVDYNEALGLWLLGWTIFTFMMWLATLRTNVCLTTLFFSLSITFLLLTIGEFKLDKDITKAGGIFGIITAFIAWYLALAQIVNKQNSFFELPIGAMPSKDHK
ncbi:uncharacterized protein MPTK1_8g09830 [Marchantia polymorpha subsp. ruderalis]|uniref:Uncharacterized protein n=1 Tax=Marchantia polymorpha TaxID=3197 RepID=A0A2R6XN15_MARPO|nr:hypothetical protein MARPO_0008s0239 [Marchantia polymorpha]BBN19341.1 hypothetical protein Mp_8g09830 [Marchantia polymorpha subsp. ruderalis]|eukprot:PTQ47493.1 hypothetical protein MARPO_0008s0239 [Marchantia polymorpha]